MSIQANSVCNFYVPIPNLPNGDAGNFSRTVIHARCDIENRNILFVLEPMGCAEDCPRVPRSWFLKCDGPARDLSFEDYKALIKALRAKTEKKEAKR